MEMHSWGDQDLNQALVPEEEEEEVEGKEVDNDDDNDDGDDDSLKLEAPTLCVVHSLRDSCRGCGLFLEN